MKYTFLTCLLALSIFVASCGRQDTPQPSTEPVVLEPEATATPDPCSEQALPDEIAKIHKLMREFDDYSALASNTPQAQLVVIIPELQRVLREAEDQKVPACLAQLKRLQLAHMNAVVQTLMAFMGNNDANLVGQGIASARELHIQYDVEMARLLGLTLVPAATAAP